MFTSRSIKKLHGEINIVRNIFLWGLKFYWDCLFIVLSFFNSWHESIESSFIKIHTSRSPTPNSFPELTHFTSLTSPPLTFTLVSATPPHSSRKEHLTTLVKKKKNGSLPHISPETRSPRPIPEQYSSRSDFYENASPSPHDRWLLSSQSIESDRRVHRISTNFFPPWPIIFYGHRQRWKELSRVESRSRWPVYWAQLPPSLPLSLSCRPMGNAFTLEYTRQPPSCASIQPADMCRINYISVNGLSAELAWTGSRGPRVSNHSGPLFLVRCAPG